MSKKLILIAALVVLLATTSLIARQGPCWQGNRRYCPVYGQEYGQMQKGQYNHPRQFQDQQTQKRPGNLLNELTQAYEENDMEKMGKIIEKMHQKKDKMRQQYRERERNQESFPMWQKGQKRGQQQSFRQNFEGYGHNKGGWHEAKQSFEGRFEKANGQRQQKWNNSRKRCQQNEWSWDMPEEQFGW